MTHCDADVTPECESQLCKQVQTVWAVREDGSFREFRMRYVDAASAPTRCLPRSYEQRRCNYESPCTGILAATSTLNGRDVEACICVLGVCSRTSEANCSQLSYEGELHPLECATHVPFDPISPNFCVLPCTETSDCPAAMACFS